LEGRVVTDGSVRDVKRPRRFEAKPGVIVGTAQQDDERKAGQLCAVKELEHERAANPGSLARWGHRQRGYAGYLFPAQIAEGGKNVPHDLVVFDRNELEPGRNQTGGPCVGHDRDLGLSVLAINTERVPNEIQDVVVVTGAG
jgi:hypothetical protein